MGQTVLYVHLSIIFLILSEQNVQHNIYIILTGIYYLYNIILNVFKIKIKIWT